MKQYNLNSFESNLSWLPIADRFRMVDWATIAKELDLFGFNQYLMCS